MTPATDIARVFVHPRPQTFETAPDPQRAEFHRRLPLYAPTPLISAPGLARRLGVRRVWVKDESSRLGLPAYKILGASWATYRELDARFGPFAPWTTLDELRGQRPSVTLVAATDGNHGRAVARTAQWLGLKAQILVPQDMAPARQDAIRSEARTCNPSMAPTTTPCGPPPNWPTTFTSSSATPPGTVTSACRAG